ncbi:MAG: cytochrome c oxidase accessory protein CcoG [Betaproteobacteria bacterium]|nr:cytochrome c oxidase accessory protein CcoG [Betaproteobacteria bacterium]
MNEDTPRNDSPEPPEGAPQVSSLYEKRKNIYIKTTTGRWTTWRWILVWFTQIVFYGLPWLNWNDRQAVLFHLVERKFYVFGLVMWPQDVIYLTIILIISAYSLFLFTAIAGRLFCGYTCPQTVYTEIFMWIENLVEGRERSARMKLDKEPPSVRKYRIKVIKHALWLLVALWTGFTFVGYFTPIHELVASIPTFSFGGWEIFWIFFYGGFTYLMAGFMREQVCKYMCPYARFQSVMFDRDTLIITYDAERGEPRSLRKKGQDHSKLGDCVDCSICIFVCPVGIDIRDGLQYECIGCGVCIDACDEVMDKLHMPRGLVRYTSENALAKKCERSGFLGHITRPRIAIYSAILAVIIGATAWSIATRIPLRVNVVKDRSVMAREVADGKIENLYILKVMNMTEAPRSFTLDIKGIEGIEISGDTKVNANAAENREVIVKVRAVRGAAEQGAHPVFFDIVADDDPAVAVHAKSTFIMQ